MTETQRRTLRDAQRAYLDQNWTDYDALVQEVAWAHVLTTDEAYALVEDGPMVF